MAARYLLVIDSAPYGNWKGRELLDMAFAVAAFDLKAALLFTGAGVNWLRQEQEPGAIEQKSVLRHLSAASLFGIEALYADSGSLRRFGVVESKSLEITEVDSVPLLQTHYQHVIRL